MKKTVTQLTLDIDSYSALTDPLSIDPTLDGGIKKNILETLNNKATNSPYIRLTLIPTATIPDPSLGIDGDFYLYISVPCLLFNKILGNWTPVDKTNDMFFFNDGVDGIRRYYSFSDNLSDIILVHELDLSDPATGAVKYTSQTLTTGEQDQARLNINAASKAYIDNIIASFKASGAIGASVAGSSMPWFGAMATVPQDWAIISTVQVWYSKIDYSSLYIALGSESNPWGLTSTTFSIPYFPEGTSVIKSGTTFPFASKGGEQKHTLDVTEIPVHDHQLDETRTLGMEEASGAYLMSGAFAATNLTDIKTHIAGGGLGHNNMSPYVAAYWIIKLKNTGGSFTATINEAGHLILTFDDGSIQDAGSFSIPNPFYALPLVESAINVEIPIESDCFIKEINIFVVSGTPTVNIPMLSTGDMTGYDIYPNVANIKMYSGSTIPIQVSGGTVKIQTIKYNV